MVAPAGGEFAENLSWIAWAEAIRHLFASVPTKALADPRPARFVARRTDALVSESATVLPRGWNGVRNVWFCPLSEQEFLRG